MSLIDPPTPWDATKLFDLANQVLGVCEQILTDAGLVVPGSVYVCGNAIPTAACEQLVVGWARIGHGTPRGDDTPMPIKGQMSPRRAWLSIWVFRCISDVLTGQSEEIRAGVVNPVAAAADAQTIMSDAYTLHKGLVIAHSAGLLGADFGSPAVIEDMIPMAAQGGIGGIRGGLVYELA